MDSSSWSHYRVSRSLTLSTIIEVPEPDEVPKPDEVPQRKEVPDPEVIPEPEEVTPAYVVVEPHQNDDFPLVEDDVEPNRCCGAIRRMVSQRMYYAIIAGGFLLLLGSITALIYFLAKYT